MKLDRTDSPTGHGKYGLLLVRRINEIAERAKDGGAAKNRAFSVQEAIATLEREGIIDWGLLDTSSEFFVIRLRDICAPAALKAYADMAWELLRDYDYSVGVRDLAIRARHSKFVKRPD